MMTTVMVVSMVMRTVMSGMLVVRPILIGNTLFQSPTSKLI